eukprot:3941902-Rhodomonas_salina.2
MRVFDGSVDLGESESGLQAPPQSTTLSGKAYLDLGLKQNARWNAAGGVADGYLVTEIPGVPGAIRSTDIMEEPQDYVQSQELLQALFWHAATYNELDGLKENGTYTVVDLPEGRKAIQSKLILNVKQDVYGQISKYKGRVVVQGFRQRKGVDFTHTYAPVAASTCIRLAVALAARRNYKMAHLDITQAFLTARLKEDEVVYVQPPKGFKEEG